MLRLMRTAIPTALAAVLSLTTAALAQDVTLRANTIGAAGGIQEAGLKALKQAVETSTTGKVKVTIFTGGALGNQESDIEALATGTLDLSTIETPITKIDPLMGVFSLPYIFKSRAHVEAVLSGPVGSEVRDRLAKKGYRVIGFYEGGFRQITNNIRPIVKPEDLKGVKMRTPGSALRIKIFQTYGANASPLPYPELYAALQTKTFDGQENPAAEVKASRFYEVQKYLSITNHIYTLGFLLLSEKTWAKLSEDQRKALVAAGEAARKATVAYGEKADAEIVDLAKSKGMVVNQADIDAFVKASAPIWEEEAGKLGAEAKDLIAKIAAVKG